MNKKLVLIGSGHAHLTTLANLAQFVSRGIKVTVIAPSDFHYYSGMGPGMLGKTYTPEQIRFATRKVVEKQGGTFCKAIATRINTEQHVVITDRGTTLPYDLLSINASSYMPDTVVEGDPSNIFPVKPIERLMQAQKMLLTVPGTKPVRVAIIGGGAAAVEIAGNTWRLLKKHQRRDFEIKLFTRRKLLENVPVKIRRAAARSLKRRNIAVIENQNVKLVTRERVELEAGTGYRADLCFLANGVQSSALFEDSDLPTGPDGGLIVNQYLQCVSHDNIFGGGDCIHYAPQPLDKVGVYAVRQNPVLYNNLLAALDGRPLDPFSPGGAYMLIYNMGDGTGVLYKNGFLLRNRLAFVIKDFIDRRFMRKYQSLEADRYS